MNEHIKKLESIYNKIGKGIFYFSLITVVGDLTMEYFFELKNVFFEEKSEWIKPNVVYSLVVFFMLNISTLKFVFKNENHLIFLRFISFSLSIIFFLIYFLSYHQVVDYSTEPTIKIIYFNLHWIHFFGIWLVVSYIKVNSDK